MCYIICFQIAKFLPSIQSLVSTTMSGQPLSREGAVTAGQTSTGVDTQSPGEMLIGIQTGKQTTCTRPSSWTYFYTKSRVFSSRKKRQQLLMPVLNHCNINVSKGSTIN